MRHGDDRAQRADITATELQAFSLLKLSPGATVDEIRRAYRSLVKGAHPDLGGSEQEWLELERARDSAVAWTARRMLPVPTSGTDMSARRDKDLVRIERRREARQEADDVRAGLIRIHTGRLASLKRSAWLVGVVAGLTGAFAVFLRSTAISPFNGAHASFTTGVVSTLGIIAAAAGIVGLGYRARADSLELLVNDANEFLADRANCLDLLDELGRMTDRPVPWTRADLDDAVNRWASIGSSTYGSAARLAHQIGPGDFGRLLIARAIANELLEEKFHESGTGDRRLLYIRRFPESPQPQAGT